MRHIIPTYHTVRIGHCQAFSPTLSTWRSTWICPDEDSQPRACRPTPKRVAFNPENRYAGRVILLRCSTNSEQACFCDGQQPWVREAGQVRVRPEGQMKIETVVRSIGGLQQEIVIGPHRLVADEPPENGGQDAGPSPFGLLTAALGA